MNAKQRTIAILVLVMSLVISGCRPPIPKGVVKGVLIGANDLPFPAGVQVIPSSWDEAEQMCTVNNDQIKKLVFTDTSGAFTFTDIPAGKYCLVLFLESEGTIGSINTSNNQIFIFEVNDASGVDLGKVSVVGVRLP